MKKILKLFDESKTLQILLEKFLIALLIMLATYCINRNLEAFKTRNTIISLRFRHGGEKTTNLC